MATYISPSGPKTTVRVLCPPVGIPETRVTGVADAVAVGVGQADDHARAGS
ncbi:MAG: hypothetical protein ACREL9_02880 [Gemmatimonadales bacterium]